MATSVDACYPQNMAEGGHDIYLGYCDGRCAFQPNPLGRPVRYIISSVATNAGVIGDVEPGNPWWDVWIPWVEQRRAAGEDPTLYCCDDGFGNNYWDGWRHADGVAHFQAAGVSAPHWWIFNFNKSYVPSYAVANQVSDNIGPGWDLSLVLDSGWPGVSTYAPPVVSSIGGGDMAMCPGNGPKDLFVYGVERTSGNVLEWYSNSGSEGLITGAAGQFGGSEYGKPGAGAVPHSLSAVNQGGWINVTCQDTTGQWFIKVKDPSGNITHDWAKCTPMTSDPGLSGGAPPYDDTAIKTRLSTLEGDFSRIKGDIA